MTKRIFLGNLLLKINGKLGGYNWRIPDVMNCWGNDLIMVLGADVTHPSPTQASASTLKSIAAVVGSVTPDLIRYGATVYQQRTCGGSEKQVREIIDNMKSMVVELLMVSFTFLL